VLHLFEGNPVELHVGRVHLVVSAKLSSADLEVGLVDVIDVGHERVVALGPIEIIVVLVVGGDQDGRRNGVGGGELDVFAVEHDLLAVNTLLGVELPVTGGDAASTSVVLLVTVPKTRVGVGEGEVVVVEAQVFVVVEESLTEACLEFLLVDVLNPGSHRIMVVAKSATVVDAAENERSGGELPTELDGLADYTRFHAALLDDGGTLELGTLPGADGLGGVVVDVELAVVSVLGVPEVLGLTGAHSEAGGGSLLNPGDRGVVLPLRGR